MPLTTCHFPVGMSVSGVVSRRQRTCALALVWRHFVAALKFALEGNYFGKRRVRDRETCGEHQAG